MDNKLTYGFLTAVLPISFSWFLMAFAWSQIPVISDNGPFYALAVSIYLILENAFDFFVFSKTNQFDLLKAKLRGLACLIVLTYTSISLFNAAPFPQVLLPNLSNVIPVLLLLASSLMAYLLRYPIFARTLLYEMIDENPGKSLMDIFNTEQLFVISSYKAVLRLRRMVLLTLALVIFLLIINSFIAITSWFLIVCFLLILVSGLGLVATANIFIDEHRIYSLGAVTPLAFKKQRLRWALSLVICCALPVLLFSANSALFPNFLGDLFNAYFHSFQASMNQPAPNNMPTLPDLQPEVELGLITPIPIAPRNPTWLLILEIGKYFLTFALITAIAWFLIRPLLKRKIEPLVLMKALIKQFIQLFILPFQAFFHFIIGLFKSKDVRSELSTGVNSQRLLPKDYLNLLIRSLKQKEKSNLSTHAKSSLTVYFTFLEWACKQGVVYQISDTPADIARKTQAMVTASLPTDTISISNINEITYLIERDLFSLQEIGNDGVLRMKKIVKQLQSLKLAL